MTTATATTVSQADTDAAACEAYANCDGNLSAAARFLGCSANTVKARIARHRARQTDAAAEQAESAQAEAAQAAAGEPESPSATTARAASGWHANLSAWTGVTDPAELAEIEQVMRDLGRTTLGDMDATTLQALAVQAVAVRAAEVASQAAVPAAKPEKVHVTECVKCGFEFSKPQVRQTCQSDKACQRRQDAKAAA